MASPPAFNFRDLSIPERLQLVEDIWDSIAHDADSAGLAVPEDHKALLDKRLDNVTKDPSAQSTWQDVRTRLYDRLR